MGSTATSRSLEQSQLQAAGNLNSAVTQVRLYVSDYLTKATSEYLPAAYSRLPDWSSIGEELPSLSASSFQHTPSPESDADGNNTPSKFSLSNLSDSQYRAIFKAFFRYELLCKIFGSHNGQSQPASCSRDKMTFMGGSHELQVESHPVDPRLRLWNWRVLDRYDNQKTSHAELALMHCVRDYIRLLSHALVSLPVTMARPAVITAHRDPESSPSGSAPPADWRSLKYYHPEYEHAGFPTLMYASSEDAKQWQNRDHIVTLCTTHGLNHLTAALKSPDQISSVTARYFPVFDEQNKVMDHHSPVIFGPHNVWCVGAYVEAPTAPWVSVSLKELDCAENRMIHDEWGRSCYLFFLSFDVSRSMAHLCRQRASALFESHRNGDYVKDAVKDRLPDGQSYIRFMRKHMKQLYDYPWRRGSPGPPSMKNPEGPPSEDKFKLKPPPG